ncbi:MAG: MATE family efflux transporter [Reyranellaceae bacterium]
MSTMTATATPAPNPTLAPQTLRLLQAPPAKLLLLLALPNIGEAAARIAFITFDAVFVGRLGTDALAGLGLVMPLFFLMQTTTAGGLGVGAAATLARALGRGARNDADAAVGIAALLALGMAACFALVMLPFGRTIYAAMGGSGGALQAALDYSFVMFLGAPFVCLTNVLANIVRGTGNMKVPAGAIIVGEAMHLTLSPILIGGLGPIPALGMTGAALAALTPYAFGTVVLALYLMRRSGLVRFRRVPEADRRGLTIEMVKIGGTASLVSISMQVLTLVFTGYVGRYGADALAAYGTAARLELIQIPLIFAFGSALIALIGTNLGAGQVARARRIVWLGALYALAISGAIGIGAALAPGLWMGLFSATPEVERIGASFLELVAPSFLLFGPGLALYFALQAAGRVVWVLAAALLRLVASLGGGFLVLALGGDLASLFACVALGYALYGLFVVTVTRVVRWPGERVA